MPERASPAGLPLVLPLVFLASVGVSACGDGEPDTAGDAGASGDTLRVTGVDSATAPEPPPDTDIYLARLQGEGPALGLEDARNATARPGYDNQPHFLPDGSGLLYTVVDDAGQADIWRLGLDAEAPVRVTATAPESEYSPTPLPGGGGFSAVRVEADSTQRLWRFAMDGTPDAPILPDVAPVGYHAWSGESTLLLFVLGDPPTLQVADIGGGAAEVIARDVGRSLQAIPGTRAVSFVQVGPDGGRTVMRWDPSGAVTPIVTTVGGGEDHAWAPDGTLLMGSGSRVMAWRPDASSGRGTGEGDAAGQEAVRWTEVGDLADLGVRTVTRLAVSPDGAWIAVVGEGA